MKSKHIIAITALAFASFTSCTSVLDKDDLTVVSEKATWNSEILATAFLDKCYKDNLPAFSGDYSKYSDEGNEAAASSRSFTIWSIHSFAVFRVTYKSSLCLSCGVKIRGTPP